MAFLLLHDWIPLGNLSDVQAVRVVDPLRKRVQVTLISALPFVLGLGIELYLCDDIALPEVGAGPLQVQPEDFPLPIAYRSRVT
jgi:hypothetical protein